MTRLDWGTARVRWQAALLGVAATVASYPLLSGLLNDPTDPPRPHGLLALVLLIPVFVATTLPAALPVLPLRGLFGAASLLSSVVMIPLALISIPAGALALTVTEDWGAVLLGELLSLGIIAAYAGLVYVAWSGLRDGLLRLRIASLLFGLGTIACYYGVARELWPRISAAYGFIPLP